jgi:hypothetical protein
MSLLLRSSTLLSPANSSCERLLPSPTEARKKANNGMSEAGNAVRKPPDDRSGLPGVRISMPPGSAGRPDAVTISTFRDDGWLDSQDAAALVRVAKGPAQVLVTVYQSPAASPESAPRLQVMRLGPEQGGEARGAAPMGGRAAGQSAAVENADVVAHVQRTGDMPGRIGEWVGTRGSGLWIEGFSLAPHDGIEPSDVEYQAVLGRGWLSPWIEGASTAAVVAWRCRCSA